MNQNQFSESFYSIRSNASAFDTSSLPRNIIVPTNQNGPKIAQSNFELDDAYLDNTSEPRAPSLKKLISPTHFGQPPIIHSRYNAKQNVQEHDISDIFLKNQSQQESMCLLRQIDCLSGNGAKVSPQELADIQKKIQMLRKEQSTMQSALSVANEMLKGAKIRNAFLQQQVLKYRKAEQSRDSIATKQVSNSRVSLNSKNVDKQSRVFPQICLPSNGESMDRLKSIYRQCSLNENYCIYQNQGYKVQIFYDRQKNISEPKVLSLSIKLTTHHHIALRKQFKFGINIENYPDEKVQMNYQGAIKIIEFNKWPESTFNINVTILEFDEGNNRQHSHILLAPLPITHFFQPRLMLIGQDFLNSTKKIMSQYTVTLQGELSFNWAETIKDKWWVNSTLSCIGHNEMSSMQIQTSEQTKTIKIQVFGKKNGNLSLGLIQFISFFLSN